MRTGSTKHRLATPRARARLLGVAACVTDAGDVRSGRPFKRGASAGRRSNTHANEKARPTPPAPDPLHSRRRALRPTDSVLVTSVGPRLCCCTMPMASRVATQSYEEGLLGAPRPDTRQQLLPPPNAHPPAATPPPPRPTHRGPTEAVSRWSYITVLRPLGPARAGLGRGASADRRMASCQETQRGS